MLELVNIHNEEYKDKMLWEIWLHRIFDQSYADFAQAFSGEKSKAPTEEEIAGIVEENRRMLAGFSFTETE